MMARERPSLVVLADGTRHRRTLGADEEIGLWARCVHAHSTGLVEVMVGRRQRNGSLRIRSRENPARYPQAGDVTTLAALVRRHRRAGDEVFASPLARQRPCGGRAGGVLPGAVAWVDVDRAMDLQRLRMFPHHPHLVVYSGSGGAHAYWRLAHVVEPEAIESANRKLAHALGGCISCTSFAATLRLPGTDNHKHRPSRPATLAAVDLARPGVPVELLVDGLDDPRPKPQPPEPETMRRWRERNAFDDARRIPPPVYFRLLARVDVPDHGGKIHCPLPDHEDDNPSCDVYATPDEGWVCFGCHRGGTIYDLASLLDHGPGGRRGELRGEDYTRVKRRVHELLGLQG